MNLTPAPLSGYRGRLAPSPTGFLHLGHARTFWSAQERAREADGTLILRMEDLDGPRCRPEFVDAVYEDLAWFGFAWEEGPDCGGPCRPYAQSQRMDHYRSVFEQLRAAGVVYPCRCSRQDVVRALSAPHTGEDEPVYPGTCRNTSAQDLSSHTGPALSARAPCLGEKVNWRFRVPDHQVVAFHDGLCGPQQFIAGRDFGDFVVWRHDNLPAYQLAVVADDAAMGITEVVRGEDLLRSTARQLLLFAALGLKPPAFAHCPLLKDAAGVRLAKRHDSLSLRSLRNQRRTPEELRQTWTVGAQPPL